MATFTKTPGVALLALQQIASNSVVLSGVQNVAGTLAATFFIQLGRDDTTGVLATGVTFRIEGSAKSAGNDLWFPIATFLTGVALPDAEAVTGTVAAGQKVITCASTTNYEVGDIVFIKNTTLANSEWGRVKAVSANVSVTMIDDLTNAQTGSTMYEQGEFFTAPNVDLAGVSRVRLVVDGSNTGRTVQVQAFMVTCDSLG